MFRKLFKEAGAKDVVTLFHKPSVPASTRVLTLLKQANASSTAHATEDQASHYGTQSKAERAEFELDIIEAPPTSDQLRSILEYLGGQGSGAPGRVIRGARDEADAIRKLKENADGFQRPLVVDWHQGKAVIGENQSEILALLKSIPKETGSV